MSRLTFPSDEGQLPDVFVGLFVGSPPRRVSFARLDARQLLDAAQERARGGEGEGAPMQWCTMERDVFGECQQDEHPGAVLMSLSLSPNDLVQAAPPEPAEATARQGAPSKLTRYLVVDALSARGLKVGRFSLDKLDPWVQVELGGKTDRTNTRHNAGSDCVWTEADRRRLTLSLGDNAEAESIRVSVFDEEGDEGDLQAESRVVGACEIPLEGILAAGDSITQSFTIYNAQKKSRAKACGEVQLRLAVKSGGSSAINPCDAGRATETFQLRVHIRMFFHTNDFSTYRKSS